MLISASTMLSRRIAGAPRFKNRPLHSDVGRQLRDESLFLLVRCKGDELPIGKRLAGSRFARGKAVGPIVDAIAAVVPMHHTAIDPRQAVVEHRASRLFGMVRDTRQLVTLASRAHAEIPSVGDLARA